MITFFGCEDRPMLRYLSCLFLLSFTVLNSPCIGYEKTSHFVVFSLFLSSLTITQFWKLWIFCFQLIRTEITSLVVSAPSRPCFFTSYPHQKGKEKILLFFCTHIIQRRMKKSRLVGEKISLLFLLDNTNPTRNHVNIMIIIKFTRRSLVKLIIIIIILLSPPHPPQPSRITSTGSKINVRLTSSDWLRFTWRRKRLEINVFFVEV